jgi:hypothetical protein
MIPGQFFAVLGVFVCVLSSWAAPEPTSDLSNDEQIVFYPACAWESSDGAAWHVEVRGCVYELEGRGFALALLREGLALKNVELTAAQETVLAQRARLFMVDNQRGKRVVIRLGKQTHVLRPSEPNGHFSEILRISKTEMESQVTGPLSISRTAKFEAVMRAGDERRFMGEIQFFDRAGWFVVSDIDDTIKVTEVKDTRAALRNTFAEPFRAVPGMALLYQQWACSNAGFFYVSASPWQLYLPLSDFMRSNGFPAGDFQMKSFRLKDRTRLNLFEDPETYKLREIEPILERFPTAHFVLVGDSGERDPEIYAALARRHPKQVARILIRNVTRQDAEAARYQEVFRGLPRQTWEVFTDPSAVNPVHGPN